MAGNYHKTKEIPVMLTRTQIKMLVDAAKHRLAAKPGVPPGPERRSLERGKAKLLEVYFGERGAT